MTPAQMVRAVLGSWHAAGTFRLERSGFKIIKGVVDRVVADFKLATSQLQLAQRNDENLQALRNLGLPQVPPKQRELENGQKEWAVIKSLTDPGVIHHLVQHAKATRTTSLVIPPYDALTLKMKVDALTAKCEAILTQVELFVKNEESASLRVQQHEGRALLEAPPTNYQQAYVQQQYNGGQQGVYPQPQSSVQQQAVYPPQYGASSSQAGPSHVVDPMAHQWYELANQQHAQMSATNGTGFVQQNGAMPAQSYAPVFNNVATQPAASNGHTTRANAQGNQAMQELERRAQQQRQQQEQERLQEQQRQQQRREQEARLEQERRQERERLMEQQRVQHERERLLEQRQQQEQERLLEQQRQQERQRLLESQQREREREQLLEQQRQQEHERLLEEQRQQEQRLLEQQRQQQRLRERLLEEQRRQQLQQAQSQASNSAQTVSQPQTSGSVSTAPTAQTSGAISQETFKESTYSSLSGALGPTPSTSTSKQPSEAAKRSSAEASAAAAAAVAAAHQQQAFLYQQAFAERYRLYGSELQRQAQAGVPLNLNYPYLHPPTGGTLWAGRPPSNFVVGPTGLVAGQRVPGHSTNGNGQHVYVPASLRYPAAPTAQGNARNPRAGFVHVPLSKPAVPVPPSAEPSARQQQPAPAVTAQSARLSTLARDILNALEGPSALASVRPAKRKRKRSHAKPAVRRSSSPGGTTSEQVDIELITPAVAQSRLPPASRVPDAMDMDATGSATIEEVDMDDAPVRKKQPLFWSDSSPDPELPMQGTHSEDDVDTLLGGAGPASASSPEGQNNATVSHAWTPRPFPPKSRAPPPAKPSISDLFREVRNGWAHPKPDRLVVVLPRLPKDWRPRPIEADYGRFSDFPSRLSTRRCHWSDCPAVLDSEDRLQLHWDKVHGAAKGYDRDFSCLWNLCEQRPTSLAKLRLHVRCRHIRECLRCAYEGCDFRGSTEADLSVHIAVEHGAGTLRRFAVPQQPVPVQIIPDLPQGVRPAWSLTTPPVRPAGMSRERRDLLGNWVLMRIYATVDYGLITAKSPPYQRGKRKEPAPPPQMEPLLEGFELRMKEQFEWMRPASPDAPKRIPRNLQVGQRPEPPV
ncbi:hypothetical protein AURDEDRAFT_110651 [Auricularia subglabra TFB-10046 SS5]|nr:hypothetical protein AURDEDRAFT_110651 [Auricularia subglabra TFB-10046 SS5]